MHLDYSIHPISGKERRVNLIVYMNPGWADAWGGELCLWEGSADGMRRLAARVAPRYNTAVLFRTSDISWHGMPDPVRPHPAPHRGRGDGAGAPPRTAPRRAAPRRAAARLEAVGL